MSVEPRGDVTEDDFSDIPRAPTQAAWDAMTDAQRAAVVETLPDYISWEEIGMPEGDPHFNAKRDTADVIRGFFQRVGRGVYVGVELAVYYPDEPRFSPDVFVALDVEDRERMKWVVSAEGKGLDLALEVLVAGRRKKDNETNVSRYARLGIPEYFVYDHRRATVRGWRLPSSGARVYEPIAVRSGRLRSEVLGLDIAVVQRRLRFFYGNAELRTLSEIVERLETQVEDLSGAVEDERTRADEERTRADEERTRADEERAAREAAEAQVAALREEIERLRSR
ncbi:MAG: Uma2 family endonuclease [Polyangiales bacterium]